MSSGSRSLLRYVSQLRMGYQVETSHSEPLAYKFIRPRQLAKIIEDLLSFGDGLKGDHGHCFPMSNQVNMVLSDLP